MLARLMRYLVRRDADPDRRRPEALDLPDRSAGRERALAALREGVAEMERGRLETAEQLLSEAIERQHDLADAHFHLGRIHAQRGELDDAADSYQMAVHFEPGHALAHHALAGLHKTQGRHGMAAEHYRRVLERAPHDAAAHCDLCLALHEMGDYAQARVHGERAVEIEPKLAEAQHNLGLVLTALGEPEEAVRRFRRALDLKPLAPIAAGLGHACRDLGRLAEAIAAYDRALRLAPDFGDAVVNRAYAYLLKGDFDAGWAEYEKRFAATGTAVRDFGLPRWDGEPLRERSILAHAEQGLGDEIMFASCLPDLIAVAGRVVVDCSDRLEALFRRSFPAAAVHGGKKEDPTDWIAGFAPLDYQIPMGSLPRRFRKDAAAFARSGPYLRPDEQRVREWRARIGAGDGQLAVGLSWRGGTPKTRSHLRSLPLELAIPLLQPGLAFVSLQHGVAAPELHGPASAIRNFTGATEDLDQLAALICALDLVVSVDNTNVHLAGALGRPVWALLPASPEWRYGLSGDIMPWYPSARLFRQGGDRRWEPVVEKVAAELAAWRGHRAAGNA